MESSDIKIYLTGGAANEDPDLSLGGTISATQLVDATLENLFGPVTAAQAEAGVIKYRAIKVKNTDVADTWYAVKGWISQLAKTQALADYSASAAFAIGIDAVGTQTVANETTAPDGTVTFTSPVSRATGISCGDVAPAGVVTIWIRLTITAGAAKDPSISHVLTFGGEDQAA